MKIRGGCQRLVPVPKTDTLTLLFYKYYCQILKVLKIDYNKRKAQKCKKFFLLIQISYKYVIFNGI